MESGWKVLFSNRILNFLRTTVNNIQRIDLSMHITYALHLHILPPPTHSAMYWPLAFFRMGPARRGVIPPWIVTKTVTELSKPKYLYTGVSQAFPTHPSHSHLCSTLANHSEDSLWRDSSEGRETKWIKHAIATSLDSCGFKCFRMFEIFSAKHLDHLDSNSLQVARRSICSNMTSL